MKLRDDRFIGAHLPCPKCRKLVLVEGGEPSANPVPTLLARQVVSSLDSLDDLEFDETDYQEAIAPPPVRKKSRSKTQRSGTGLGLLLGVLAGIVLSFGGWLILHRSQPHADILPISEKAHPGREVEDVSNELMKDVGKASEEESPFVEIDDSMPSVADWLKWVPADTQQIDKIDYRLLRKMAQTSKLLNQHMATFVGGDSAARVFEIQATLRDVDSMVMATPSGVVTDSDRSSDNTDRSYVLAIVTFHDPGLISFDSQFPKKEYRGRTLFEIRKSPQTFACKLDDRLLIAGPEALVQASLDTDGQAPVASRFAFVPSDHLMICATSPRSPGIPWRRSRDSQFFSARTMSNSITGVYNATDFEEKQQTELGVSGSDMKICEKACRQSIDDYRQSVLSKRDEGAKRSLPPSIRSAIETMARCVDQMARDASYTQKNGVAIGRMITPDELLAAVRQMSGKPPAAEPAANSVISPPPVIVIPSPSTGRAPTGPVNPGF